MLPALGPKWPLPFSATLAAPPALLVTFSVAFFAPMVVGVNVTCTVVDTSEPSVVVPSVPSENCPPSPVIVGVFSVIGNPLVFVMVTGVAPCDPRNTVTESTGEGVNPRDAPRIETEYDAERPVQRLDMTDLVCHEQAAERQ